MVVFMIVGKSEPLYEADIGAATDDLSYLYQFILHSSLDMLHTVVWNNPSTYLKNIDRFNALQVSAFVTPGGMTFLLLHSGKNEETMKNFFTDVNEVYVKYLMNPFAVYDSPIVSPQFDMRIRSLAKMHFSES